MPDIEELYPPLGYDWYWWLVLPAFIILLVAWILLSKRVARLRGFTSQPGAPVPFTPYRPPVDPRVAALNRIAKVETALRAGGITVRDAHIELSSILRDFAYARTGVDARTMTLEELRTSKLGVVADLVEDFYPVAFSPDPSTKVDDSITNVRAVVRSWN